MYMMAKHIHLTAVALSVFLFVLRFIWSQFSPAVLEKKWLKITPHVVDTILLISALSLCVMLNQYPFVQGWLTFKVVGLVVYILMGLFALKWARNAPLKWIGFIGALTWLALIAKVAVTKQPLFF
ncbi:SirB2 family protein [Alteromonas sp. C1M14]|uniref:SirB2 family protein n=1 Tax=Alteromonas sp. C1M14 TaxID=2841567 RepID=UPI001C091D9A|nr:SirB2 family protein [Alteromonas sp. C1M14]MBU2978880.1 SirB2 family protein [Alteromonas sp. C1M14]